MNRMKAELRKQLRKQSTRLLYKPLKRLGPDPRALEVPSEFTEEREKRIRIYEQSAEQGLPLFE